VAPAAAEASGRAAAESDEERDFEREEFEAELARVAAELERVSGAASCRGSGISALLRVWHLLRVLAKSL
jgi:hypothetical protein